ncbi:MAG: HTH-type transcriptional regulator MalT [Acidimicrobiales bacterium]|nr:HTH-type transcriptional regulator MalT [Acidimicrobiales bacterium]
MVDMSWQQRGRLGHAALVAGDPPVEPTSFPPSRFSAPRQALSLPRPAVIDALTRAVEEHVLTLLVAPGGSGKTTAMAWWVAEAGQRPAVWARFERQDDDPLSVANVLLAALRHRLPGAGRRLDQVLAMGTAAEVHSLAVALVNDLAEHRDIVLVLDDLHTIDAPESLELLGGVLDNMPTDARMIAASRTDPALSLARRRVRRELGELRGADLRLDAPAVRAVLEQAGVHGDVSAQQILDYSGGWAAAVHLAAVRAAGGHRPPEPAGPARGTRSEINDFFTEEVLADLPADLRSFLLETSLLGEFDAEMCAAVTGRDDAAALLDEILRRDLFVGQFGDEQAALRYHDLFAGFLRERLITERPRPEVDALRRRAAACSPTGDALRLLVDAGEVDAAAELISGAGRAQLAGSGAHVPDAWVNLLPPAARRRHPWVGLLAGLGQVRRGQMLGARHELQAALDELRDAGDQFGTVEAEFALAEARMGLGDMAAAEQLFDALQAQPLGPDERIRLLNTRFWHNFFATDWSAASSSLEEAFDLAFGGASDIGRKALAMALGTESLFVDAGPAWLHEQCRRLARAIGEPDSPAGASLRMADAAAAFLAGDIEGCMSTLSKALTVSREHGGLGWLDLALDRLRLAAASATGDHATIAAISAQASRCAEASDVHHQERAMYAYAQARSALTRQRPGELADIRDHWLGDVSDNDRPDAAVTLMVIDAHIAGAAGREDEAAHLLEAAAELHRAVRFSLMTGQPLLELATMQLEAGHEHEALNTAHEALGTVSAMDAPGLLLQDGPGAHKTLLERCAQAGLLRQVVTAALAWRAAPGRPNPLAVPGTGAELSVREVEVLRRVVAGDSNRAIAEALFISERTVKTHMTSLLRKLGASSRTQAVARVRELGLAL